MRLLRLTMMILGGVVLFMSFLLSQTIDCTTNNAIQFSTNLEKSDISKVYEGPRQGAVLWDTTHGPYLAYYPSGSYSNVCQMLVDSGFTVDVCGTGVHTVNLNLYDVIVLSVTSNWYSSYSQEEVDSVVSYYYNGNERIILTGDGNFCDNSYMPNADNRVFAYNVFEWLSQTGGLLIMGENPGCPNDSLNPVSLAFNLDHGLGDLGASFFSNLAAHPVYSGVTQLYYIAGGEISASTPSQVIGWTDGTNLPTVAERDETVSIEFLGFSFSLTRGGVLLKWETGCESNNAAWLVERKRISEEWEEIARIPSSGNSPAGSSYSYTDTGIDNGIVYYYRVGSIERNGKIEWLSTIEVDTRELEVSKGSILSILPNPFSSEVRIYISDIIRQNLDDRGQMLLEIHDIGGREVKGFPISSSQFPIVIDWDGRDNKGRELPTGFYFAVYSVENRPISKRKVILLR
jgi:hypothetical protein